MTRTDVLPRDWAWFLCEIALAVCLGSAPVIVAGTLDEPSLRAGLVLAAAFLVPAELLRQFVGFEGVRNRWRAILNAKQSAEPVFADIARAVEIKDQFASITAEVGSVGRRLGDLTDSVAKLEDAQRLLAAEVARGHVELRAALEARETPDAVSPPEGTAIPHPEGEPQVKFIDVKTGGMEISYPEGVPQVKFIDFKTIETPIARLTPPFGKTIKIGDLGFQWSHLGSPNYFLRKGDIEGFQTEIRRLIQAQFAGERPTSEDLDDIRRVLLEALASAQFEAQKSEEER